MARAGLAWLATADRTALTGAERAGCLAGLERVAGALVAARSRVAGAFEAQRDFEPDGSGRRGRGCGGAAGWLARPHPRSQGGRCGWASIRRSHGRWRRASCRCRGRALCDGSEALPEQAREDGDQILQAAAAAGASLADLAHLAEEIRRRTARPDPDRGDDGFEDRSVRLAMRYQGAGRLTGDLTPRCAAAVQAVLDALGKRRGPEDTRTRAQREHDALEEAMRRLIASGCLPDRAGQPASAVRAAPPRCTISASSAASITWSWSISGAGPSGSIPTGR